jgi:hypothetical protein
MTRDLVLDGPDFLDGSAERGARPVKTAPLKPARGDKVGARGAKTELNTWMTQDHVLDDHQSCDT